MCYSPDMSRPVREGLFTVDSEGTARLLAARCTACGAPHFPAGMACPYCGCLNCDRIALGPAGWLLDYTCVRSRPPGYEGPVPFGLGVVELPEGLRVIARLSGPDLEAFRYGQPLRMVLDTVGVDAEGQGLVSYAFAPDSGGPSLERGAAAGTCPRVHLPAGAAVVAKRPVEIAAVGLHPFGRFADRDAVALGAAAVDMALRGAELGRGGFQAAYCGTVYAGVAAGHRVLSTLGLTGVPVVNVEAGCASGGAALLLGLEAIQSGRCDCVLVFGIEKMPRGMIRSSFFPQWQEEAGLAATPAYFALRARRLMRESGVTREQLAQVVVKNRRHGAHNPFAMFREEVALEEVLGSPMVCDPLTLFMLCSPNEGAGAVVLRAAKDAGPRQVRIAAAALRSHLPGNVLGEHTPLSGIASEPPSPTELAARDAYEAAGIGPGDFDVAEVQDTDAGRELLAYEELGLCGRGESGAWIAEGRTQIGGPLPVNPSGGLLARGEPLGASALAQVVELYLQLRGEAGPRQVPGARTALAHTVGRGANACVIVLER